MAAIFSRMIVANFMALVTSRSSVAFAIMIGAAGVQNVMRTSKKIGKRLSDRRSLNNGFSRLVCDIVSSEIFVVCDRPM